MSSSIAMNNAVGPPATATGMETVVAIALGALAAVFLGAFVVLLVICRRQRCYYVSVNDKLREGRGRRGMGVGTGVCVPLRAG